MVPDITNLDLLCPLRQPRDLTTISDSNSIVCNKIHGWQVRLRSSATRTAAQQIYPITIEESFSLFGQDN